MIVPRIGAVLLLIGYGFAAAQVGRLMFVTAREGYSSWIPVALFVAPSAILGLASALLVLWRKPLGRTLAKPFLAVLAVTALITVFGLPPVGRFLDDYERAAIARGVDVPAYYDAKGLTEQDYVESQTSDVRAQGGLGALIAAAVYGACVLRGGRPLRHTAPPAQKARA